MPFRVSTNGTGADEVITLENTTSGTKVDIFAFGALLNAFCVKRNGSDFNVIYGFKNPADAHKNITPLFQSAKLSPFVCRLHEGHYTFANEKHKIEKYYSYREAIHGLIYDAVFTVTNRGESDDSAFVTLSFDYDKADPGYPFFYRIAITFTLKRNSLLTIATEVTNLNAVSIPISDGWHPYFTLHKKVDDLNLVMNVNELVEFDNRLLPTGNFLPYSEFTEPQPIGKTALDNCFVINKENPAPACTISDPEAGIAINILPQKNYPFLQVFIPDNRQSIAIENLSSLPDAFNNAIGLTILESGMHCEYVTAYQVQTL